LYTVTEHYADEHL